MWGITNNLHFSPSLHSPSSTSDPQNKITIMLNKPNILRSHPPPPQSQMNMGIEWEIRLNM